MNPSKLLGTLALTSVLGCAEAENAEIPVSTTLTDDQNAIAHPELARQMEDIRNLLERADKNLCQNGLKITSWPGKLLVTDTAQCGSDNLTTVYFVSAPMVA